MILGDFNSVRFVNEKCNGVPPTIYELQDFDECCVLLGLSDSCSVGCRFTWINNTVWCKLDRVLLNNAWHVTRLSCLTNFLPPGCLSDHSPAIVSLFQSNNDHPRPFKFFNMWASHQDFQRTVGDVWGMFVHGISQFSLCKKLKALKMPLKAFNQTHFGHISARADQANQELNRLQLLFHDQPTNDSLRELVAKQKKKTFFLAEAERHFFSQKSKMQLPKVI